MTIADPGKSFCETVPTTTSESEDADQKNATSSISNGTAPTSPGKSPWVTYTTPEGHPYYYNVITSVTSWEKPAELDSKSQTIMPNPVVAAATGFGPVGCNVYLFHLPHEWTEAEIRNVFSPYGQILGVRVPRCDQSGKNKGYAFVSYESNKAALNAVVGLNGLHAGGKWLKVTLKKGEEEYYPAGFPQGNHRTVVEQQRQHLHSLGLLDHAAQAAGDAMRLQQSLVNPKIPQQYMPPGAAAQYAYQNVAYGYPAGQSVRPPVVYGGPPTDPNIAYWGHTAQAGGAYRYQPY
eukprot:GHVL01018826.1.p2 GENE.GHVL01018826.1~~GHVL01018826.1.p2  ORF type:complete len:292 (+),score=57.13 GHVL01018826.1:2389-3264(+)